MQQQEGCTESSIILLLTLIGHNMVFICYRLVGFNMVKLTTQAWIKIVVENITMHSICNGYHRLLDRNQACLNQLKKTKNFIECVPTVTFWLAGKTHVKKLRFFNEKLKQVNSKNKNKPAQKR